MEDLFAQTRNTTALALCHAKMFNLFQQPKIETRSVHGGKTFIT
jgi:hypothetical protein